jgi:hypothetical protein
MEWNNTKLYVCYVCVCVCVCVSNKNCEVFISYSTLRCSDYENLKDIEVDARKTQSKRNNYLEVKLNSAGPPVFTTVSNKCEKVYPSFSPSSPSSSLREIVTFFFFFLRHYFYEIYFLFNFISFFVFFPLPMIASYFSII